MPTTFSHLLCKNVNSHNNTKLKNINRTTLINYIQIYNGIKGISKMVLFQFNLGQFIQVFIIQGIIALFFVYLIFRILNRGQKRINLLFALSYVFVLIGLVNNMIYSFIRNEPILIIMNFVTNFSITFGLIFLTLFNLILFYSETRIDTRKQVVIIVLYGAILFLKVLFLPFGGLSANETTNWRILWSFPYYLYVTLVITIGSVIPTFYLSFRIYFEMKEPELKKKWIFFIIGALGIIIYMYGVFTVDLFNDMLIRFIWTLISLTIVLWVYLMYYGVGRQLTSQ